MNMKTRTSKRTCWLIGFLVLVFLLALYIVGDADSKGKIIVNGGEVDIEQHFYPSQDGDDNELSKVEKVTSIGSNLTGIVVGILSILGGGGFIALIYVNVVVKRKKVAVAIQIDREDGSVS